MKCEYCGGLMVIEYLGSYGNAYRLKKNGEPSKKRIKRFIYEEDGSYSMIYCLNCRREPKAKEEP